MVGRERKQVFTQVGYTQVGEALLKDNCNKVGATFTVLRFKTNIRFHKRYNHLEFKDFGCSYIKILFFSRSYDFVKSKMYRQELSGHISTVRWREYWFLSYCLSV